MKNLIILGVMLIWFSGCASMNEITTVKIDQSLSAIDLVNSQPLTSMAQIKIGMTYAQVNAILGSTLVIGVQKDNEGLWQKTIINQPYQRENIRVKEKTYEVLYFLTDIKKTDGIVSDDELTPLIFDGDILIAEGWEFLFSLRTGSRL